MIYAANYWLNMFLHKGGISQTMSLHTLLTGLTMNYNRHCRLEFGEYVQTHEEHDNSLNPRTIGALALHPTGNVQGGYFFFSLTTGKVINRMRWTTIPMPKEVIDRVERMACQEHAGTTLLFEDRDHNEIPDLDQDDDDDNSDYEPNNDEDDGNDDDDDDNNAPTNQLNEPYEDPGTLGEEDAQQHNNEENNNEQYNNEENNNENDGDNNKNNVVDENNKNDDGENGNDNIHDEYDQAEPTNDNYTARENVNAEEINDAVDYNPGGITGVDPEPLPPIQVQNERTQRELNWIAWMGQQPPTFAGWMHAQAREHATTNVMTEPNNSTMTDFERDLFHRRVAGIQLPLEYEDQLTTLKHTVLTQYTLKKDLQVFGPKGTEAVFSKMKQLHERNVCVGKNIGQQYCWCSLMWLMPLRSLSNCDYELNFYLRLRLGPIHSNQVMGQTLSVPIMEPGIPSRISSIRPIHINRTTKNATAAHTCPPVQNNQPGTGFGSRGKSVGLGPSVTPLG